MIIIGAGMAGLLAAGMLRNEATLVAESQGSLPNNHSALLRFRSGVVGDTLNIPFKAVNVMKSVDGNLNPVAAALAYSMKTNGTATLRSITSAEGTVERRYVAPADLVNRMLERVSCPVLFGQEATLEWIQDHAVETPLISTVPMGVLMHILGWPEPPEFRSVSGYNINATIENADAYATVYLPDRIREENRVSLTGNKLTIEVSLPKLSSNQVTNRVVDMEQNIRDIHEVLNYALKVLGLSERTNQVMCWSINQQRYAKILPIDETVRQKFIVWASENFNVYSLGRFATWRPGLLLDDVVNDVRVIQKLVGGRGAYDHRKKGL